MLAYLSKKISIPNDTLVSSLAWHSNDGYLAVGGNNGLLRVLKLEIQQQQDKESRVKGLAAPSVLTMNQTLEAHHGSVVEVTWNESENKLTTCDKNGLIVVWFKYDNCWTQEMINNRNRSAVSMVHWNINGQKICIVYEDGAIIVGSVDGNRIWGKDIQGSLLTHVQWSPDSRVLVFGTSKGEVLIYDSLGAYNSKLSLHCLVGCTGSVKLISVQWYNGVRGYLFPGVPCLAVAFDNGRVQVMRHELDDKPVVIDVGMNICTVRWNHNGSVLAISGNHKRTDDREICVTHFYSPIGTLLYTLKIPGRGLSSIAWEGSGLRLALGIGSYIYFANIRYNYQWTYFSNTLVYWYKKPVCVDEYVMFWNVANHQQNIKTCHNLKHIQSCKDYCLLVTTPPINDTNQYLLLLCNSLGIPVDSRYISITPLYVGISQTHVIACNSNAIYVWHYRAISNVSSTDFNLLLNRALETNDKLIHVDERVVSSDVDSDKINKMTSDPISGVAVSEHVMTIGRLSGDVLVYELPGCDLTVSFNVGCQPLKLSLNVDSSKLSVIDNNGIFSLYDMKERVKLGHDRKEVWNMVWADDDSELFAIMEKTRMYIFRGAEPEEPIVSSAIICCFSNLQVKGLLIDELMKNPESPSLSLMFDFESKSLRDTRKLLDKVGFEDTFQFINDNPHVRLWELLAESALKAFNFDIAEKSFVKCKNYAGIQFVKKLKKLTNDDIRRAQIAGFYGNFDEAEKIYLHIDRKDLAIDMRTKLCDWFRVTQLMSGGGSHGNDKQLANAWKCLGDHYSERHMWRHALGNYQMSGEAHAIAEAHIMLENYDELEDLINGLPDNDEILPTLADKFRLMGLCQSATTAYLKCGKTNKALECCIELNEWSQAKIISSRFGLDDVDKMIIQKANELLNDNCLLLAVQLYKRAGYYIEAAKLLNEVAKMASSQKLSLIKIKKLYVMSGLMVEEYRNYVKNNTTLSDKVASTLRGYLVEGSSVDDVSVLDKAWQGAEAYHLIMLAHRYLYDGDFEKAMKLGMILQSYTDILDPVVVYSLLCVSAVNCHTLSIASLAMMRLEMLPTLSQEKKEEYEELSVQMFKLHPPRDKCHPLICPRCESPFDTWKNRCDSCNGDVTICMSTGDIILVEASWMCPSCRHKTHASIGSNILSYCPLCHANIN